MTFLMLKNEDDSVWKLYATMFIQCCQLLSLVFNPNITFPWKGHSVETAFEKIFQSFQIVYWIQYTDWTTFLVIFYCTFALVIFSFFIAGYSIYNISNKHTTILWPLKLLRLATGFYLTILHMPIICNLSYIFRCSIVFATV